MFVAFVLAMDVVLAPAITQPKWQRAAQDVWVLLYGKLWLDYTKTVHCYGTFLFAVWNLVQHCGKAVCSVVGYFGVTLQKWVQCDRTIVCCNMKLLFVRVRNALVIRSSLFQMKSTTVWLPVHE